MINSKYINKICYCGIAIVLIITILFINGEKLGIKKADTTPKYAVSLFDTSKVHEIDIVMNNFDSFLKTCESEEYTKCSLVIDGNSVKNIAIRGKGNTSLRSVKEYNSQRYSFKIEFDHYNSANTYLGLDKLCLNNIIQDNTYMKDYLAYTLMNESGVNSPLCSFAHITVNGEEWGLYLAVEAIDNSFLKRCYGKNYGNLYKPDAMNMGGGKGNGKAFDKDKFEKEKVKENKSTTTEEMLR